MAYRMTRVAKFVAENLATADPDAVMEKITNVAERGLIMSGALEEIIGRDNLLRLDELNQTPEYQAID